MRAMRSTRSKELVVRADEVHTADYLVLDGDIQRVKQVNHLNLADGHRVIATSQSPDFVWPVLHILLDDYGICRLPHEKVKVLAAHHRL